MSDVPNIKFQVNAQATRVVRYNKQMPVSNSSRGPEGEEPTKYDEKLMLAMEDDYVGWLR